jgi:hypothetical protein
LPAPPGSPRTSVPFTREGGRVLVAGGRWDTAALAPTRSAPFERILASGRGAGAICVSGGCATLSPGELGRSLPGFVWRSADHTAYRVVASCRA